MSPRHAVWRDVLLSLGIIGPAAGCSRADFGAKSPKGLGGHPSSSSAPGPSSQDDVNKSPAASGRSGPGQPGSPPAGGERPATPGEGSATSSGTSTSGGVGTEGADAAGCRGGPPPPAGPAIEITSEAQLAAIVSNKSYHLANDLTLSGAWSSLGNFANVVFDGGGHTISGMGAGSTGYSGSLFAQIFCSKVSNLTLDAPRVEIPDGYAVKSIGALAISAGASTIDGVAVVGGVVTGYEGVGGLVGIANDGTVVTNSSASAEVHASFGAGGLIGGLEGGTVTHCHATGKVVSGNGAGGLIAAVPYGAVATSFATGGVFVGAGASGGLIAQLGSDDPSGPTATLADSFASGDVHGAGEAGGLLGYVGKGIVTNAYARGKVLTGASGMTAIDSGPWRSGDGIVDFGGLVGDIHLALGQVNASYWDVTTTAMSQSAGGTATSDDAMKVAGTFAGWDFSNVWTLGADGYPSLR